MQRRIRLKNSGGFCLQILPLFTFWPIIFPFAAKHTPNPITAGWLVLYICQHSSSPSFHYGKSVGNALSPTGLAFSLSMLRITDALWNWEHQVSSSLNAHLS